MCALENKLGEADWDVLSNLNCEESFEAFQSKFCEILDACAPQKRRLLFLQNE